MGNVAPYHTDSCEDPHAHKNVYHDHAECQDGRAIKPEHRKPGTGNKPRCKVCTNLESSM